MKSPKLKRAKKLGADKTPAGVWEKCNSCGEILQSAKIEDNLFVCPFCQHHFRMTSSQRMKMLVDAGTFEPLHENLTSVDPLNFVDKKTYKDRLEQAQKNTGLADSTICGKGKIHGCPVAIAIMDFKFMGGSMGVVAGEKVALTMDLALEERIPAIVISCSGGARMQEGILSLMQMAKTSGARQRLKHAGIPYISLLTDPTTGGCAASYAMLGDINLSEPKALIGFAGPRVIEQSIRQSLPEGFQRSEFLLEHGFIDRIIHRRDLKRELSFFIEMFSKKL